MDGYTLNAARTIREYESSIQRPKAEKNDQRLDSLPLCSEETNCLKWTSRQSDNMGYSVRNIWISVTMSMQA